MSKQSPRNSESPVELEPGLNIVTGQPIQQTHQLVTVPSCHTNSWGQQTQKQCFRDQQQQNWNCIGYIGSSNSFNILDGTSLGQVQQQLTLQQDELNPPQSWFDHTSFVDGLAQQIIQVQQQHPVYSFVAQVKRKERVRWSPRLHKCFVEVVHELGGPWQATPKLIVSNMKQKGILEDLSINHVKSHLQKFRQMLQGSNRNSSSMIDEGDQQEQVTREVQTQVNAQEPNLPSALLKENNQEIFSQQDFQKFVDLGRSCQERMKQLTSMYESWQGECERIRQSGNLGGGNSYSDSPAWLSSSNPARSTSKTSKDY